MWRTFIRISGIISHLIHPVSVPWYEMIWMRSACVSVRNSLDASWVKSAPYRCMPQLFVTHPLQLDSISQFSKMYGIFIGHAFLTQYTWVSHISVQTKAILLWYYKVFPLLSLQHATSFINIWWDGNSPKTTIGRGIVSHLKSCQMEVANFRALVKCLMKEVSSSVAPFRTAY